MKSMNARHYVLEAVLRRDGVPSFDSYPFSLPIIRGLHRLKFNPSVTFITGENGAGKSTLLEAIALASGFNPEGGSRNFNFSTRDSHSVLHGKLSLRRGIRRPKDGFFFRGESFFNVATEAERLGVLDSYGGRSLHEQSHGEAFLSLVMNRFRGRGLYLLDEPEAALSPTRLLGLLRRIHDLVRDHSQFIIVTHSPILLAYPDASILYCDERGIHEVEYERTEHFAVTVAFLNNYRQRLAQLLG
ncbi:MAG: AAA family ATPase [Elusimicrobiota bacterium]